MRKFFVLSLITTVWLCSCTTKHSKVNVSEVVSKDSVEISTECFSTQNNTPLSTNTDYNTDDVDLDDWGKGFLVGSEDGANDGLEGYPRRYKYGNGHSSAYINGYKEAYDESYSTACQVNYEAEREMERLESECDISDYDYNDYDY